MYVCMCIFSSFCMCGHITMIGGRAVTYFLREGISGCALFCKGDIDERKRDGNNAKDECGKGCCHNTTGGVKLEGILIFS